MLYNRRNFVRIDLRKLIIILSLFASIATLFNGFLATYSVQEKLLIDNTLSSNLAYADKLAGSADVFVGSTFSRLRYSANILSDHFDDAVFVQGEAKRLREEVDSLNSVVIVSSLGVVKGVSPETLSLLGRTLNTPGAERAIRERKAIVSEPYVSAANNLVVFTSQPIVNHAGEYIGYVGGSVYLRDPGNVLSVLLGKHYYNDGSYIYVVDKDRMILYHPERDRIGKVVEGNEIFSDIGSVKSGAKRVFNSFGIDMLAGYSKVESTGWIVVAQRPTDITLESLFGLMVDTLVKTIPLAVIIFALIWWLARVISDPLRKLAAGARNMNEEGMIESIKSVRAWYFESSGIKRAMLVALNLLHERIGKLTKDAQTDPLTAINNRRGLEVAITMLKAECRNFSVISVDIDYFKRVNDTYGHDVGDVVLRRLADIMKSCSREHDIPCRVGGEEFVVLVPGVTGTPAYIVAERLRKSVGITKIEPVGNITVSIGVASYNSGDGDVSDVFKRADEAMYESKSGGRNKVTCFF